jgi:hypothetical protein
MYIALMGWFAVMVAAAWVVFRLIAEHAMVVGFCVTAVVVLVAAVIDFRRFRVPNTLTFPVVSIRPCVPR